MSLLFHFSNFNFVYNHVIKCVFVKKITKSMKISLLENGKEKFKCKLEFRM